jgi:hypothetical protein
VFLCLCFCVFVFVFVFLSIPMSNLESFVILFFQLQNYLSQMKMFSILLLII